MADAPTCPYCRSRPGAPEFTPFCSERCKMADLGRWLSEDYRIGGKSPEGDLSPSPADADDTEDELRSDRD